MGQQRETRDFSEQSPCLPERGFELLDPLRAAGFLSGFRPSCFRLGRSCHSRCGCFIRVPPRLLGSYRSHVAAIKKEQLERKKQSSRKPNGLFGLQACAKQPLHILRFDQRDLDAMRNLSLAAELITELPDLTVSRTTIDLDENVLYAVSENHNIDGEVEVKIWRILQVDEVGSSTVGV